MEEVIRRVTGLPVEHVDDGAVSGYHDAEIYYPDGGVAAVEMTTLSDPVALEMLSFPIELELPETPHWWDFRYPPSRVLRRDIERHVPALVRWLDLLDLDDADKAEDVIYGTAEWAWYERTAVRLRRFSGTSRGGRVDVLPEGSGGAIDEYLEGLAGWVESLQAEPIWIDNVAKLARSGHEELHLAFRLHESRVPFSIWSALWDADEIRSPDPSGMDPLTDLWLFVGYGTTVTRWSREVGWTSHVFRGDGMSAIPTD